MSTSHTDGSKDGSSKYQDFSGLGASQDATANPYKVLIDAANNDPVQIQERYEIHRRTRNNQQEAKLLDKGFAGADIDPILYKLVHKNDFPDFKDTRYCLVFWARPTVAVKKLISEVQQRLTETLPGLWVMPPDNLHMTAMEISHSLTEPEIAERVDKLLPLMEQITDFTLSHRARLVRPMLGFDASAFALSFVPSAGKEGDEYTYHHLRRDLHALCGDSGVEVASRYVVPSSHFTIARFITQKDTSLNGDPSNPPDPVRMKAVMARIHEINKWLEESYWRTADTAQEGIEWMVGQEKGLECYRGTLWYGSGGERVRLGKGY